MRKINALIFGIASLFSVTSTINVDKIIEKYSAKNEDAKSELARSWRTVGNAIQGAIDTYEQKKN